MPGIYAPYEIDGSIYVDGGLTDPLPISYARKSGEGKVLAIDISSQLNDGRELDGLLSVLTKSFEIIYQRLSTSQHDKADYEKGKEVVQEHKDKLLEVFTSKNEANSEQSKR